MHLVLLPGLDGTGLLFQPFLSILPAQITATVIAYPPDKVLEYDALLQHIQAQLPVTEPYIIVAESFSGPLAIQLASQGLPNLQAIVLCATFVTAPLSAVGRVIVQVARHVLFRFRPPTLAVRYFLLGFDATPALLKQFYAALALVTPKVLAERVKLVLAVDQRSALAQLTIPVLVLIAAQDHLIAREQAGQSFGTHPQVRVEWVDSPHLLLQTKPEVALQKILRYNSTELRLLS